MKSCSRYGLRALARCFNAASYFIVSFDRIRSMTQVNRAKVVPSTRLERSRLARGCILRELQLLGKSDDCPRLNRATDQPVCCQNEVASQHVITDATGNATTCSGILRGYSTFGGHFPSSLPARQLDGISMGEGACKIRELRPLERFADS